MRFKTGSKVEVLSKNEVPSGSWRCAEIICGNGHNYTVRYDGYASTIDEAFVERVSRKAIRPCQPTVEVSENWIPGDIVEVFHNFSWKMATVSKILGAKYHLVRLLGSSREFKVNKFDLRVRLTWQDDKWVMIGKGSRNCEGGKRNEWSSLKYNQNPSSQVQQTDPKTNLRERDDCFSVKSNINFHESHNVSSRILKRGLPYCYSQVEACAGATQKFRATEKEGRRHRGVAENLSPLPEKGQSRRLLHLSSKCLKVMLGFAIFLFI